MGQGEGDWCRRGPRSRDRREGQGQTVRWPRRRVGHSDPGGTSRGPDEGGRGTGGVEGCVPGKLEVRELSGAGEEGQSRASGHSPGPMPGPPASAPHPEHPALAGLPSIGVTTNPKSPPARKRPSPWPPMWAEEKPLRVLRPDASARRGMELTTACRYFSCSKLLESAWDWPGGGGGAAAAGGWAGRRAAGQTAPGAGSVPGDGAFWALKRPTTPLPCRPPERSSTALERPLRQQTTGKRFWR